jgi:hypothetical protein
MDKKKVSLFLLIIFFLNSCSQVQISRKDKAFNDLIHIRDLNKSIRLESWTIDEINNLHIGDSIDLAAQNNTKYNIELSSDNWIRIFAYDKSTNEWIDIPNLMNYYPVGNRILFPKNDESDGIFGFSVYPSVINNSKPIEIRIVVTGETKNRIPIISKQVGAYIDLILQP